MLLIFNLLISLSVFFVLLIVFKKVDKEDIKFMLDIFNIVKYKESIKEEFML